MPVRQSVPQSGVAIEAAESIGGILPLEIASVTIHQQN
jgi:hypothetical protein